MVGIGVRLAQDVGAHRKGAQSRRPTVEDEMWKRAFWCVYSSRNLFSIDVLTLAVRRVLLCLDRTCSAGLGRPCAIQDEE